jgi:hypothetical protein
MESESDSRSRRYIILLKIYLCVCSLHSSNVGRYGRTCCTQNQSRKGATFGTTLTEPAIYPQVLDIENGALSLVRYLDKSATFHAQQLDPLRPNFRWESPIRRRLAQFVTPTPKKATVDCMSRTSRATGHIVSKGSADALLHYYIHDALRSGTEFPEAREWPVNPHVQEKGQERQ